MNAFEQLWSKFARSKKYREEFVAAQVKRGIPFQIRAMLRSSGLPQDEIASRAGLTQGVVSRAANPDYGNLTLNTLIRIAAGFDVAFIGKFVPFSELGRWFIDLSKESVNVKSFGQEDSDIFQRLSGSTPPTNIEDFKAKRKTKTPHLYGVQGRKRTKMKGRHSTLRRKPVSSEQHVDISGGAGSMQTAQGAING